MSSSYLDVRRVSLLVGSFCSLGIVGAAHSAQIHVQPQVLVRAETNSNFDLSPDGSPDGSVEGYIGDLQLLAGYFTPRGETSIRPRVRLQHYPDREQREEVEGFLDWVTRYNWERSRFSFNARYAHEDSFNYDTRSGEFDPLDPTNPTEAASGRFLVNETRTDLEVRPRYTYEITERLSAGIRGEYQTTDFDADQGQARQVDYHFWRVNADLRWALDERSNVGIGAYVSQYDAKAGDGDSDGYGVGLSYDLNWTETTGVEVTLGYQVDDPTYPEPGEGDQKSSSVGGSIVAFGAGEVSQWRVSASQRYAPGSNGRMRQMDLLRFQYDRDLSQRLAIRGAARYESQDQLTTGSSARKEENARLDLSLRWSISRTWFVEGGYAYIWQQEPGESDADNNRFFLSTGYRGLARER